MYGVVHEAICRSSGRRVALKRIRMGNNRQREGLTFTALRELKFLRRLKHENIVEMVDVFQHKSSLVMVFELMAIDLEQLVKARQVALPLADIKYYMEQGFRALHFLHSQWILHRDIKPNNFLVSVEGAVKLGDFGLARTFGSPSRELTYQVVTRWYRGPELLYGARHYGPSVDSWAMGCVFAELLLRNPFLPGESDLDQLGKMFHALGTPTEKDWLGMTSLPQFMQFTECPGTPLEQIFPAAGADALDLLRGLFRFNPSTRLTSTDALAHRYFQPASQPGVSQPADLTALQLIAEIRGRRGTGHGAGIADDAASGPQPSAKRTRINSSSNQGTRKKLLL